MRSEPRDETRDKWPGFSGLPQGSFLIEILDHFVHLTDIRS